jgi:predicted nucleotidyltransferase
MSKRTSSPTPYPEVNAILDILMSEVQAILDEQFIGMYLYGSLAYGGFDRASDVDFVVVTAEELPDATISTLQEMHSRIAKLDSWCATQLEGSYIPRRALRAFDPQRVFHLHIDRGPGEPLKRMQIDDPRLSRAWWGGWVFLRHVLWQDGIALAGPDPRTLVEPVRPGELRQAARANVEDWLAPLLDEPEELHHYGYQSYCVLTMCRLLYTLETDATTSKQAAARWAKERLEPRWAALIERAWIDRQNPQSEIPPDNIRGTLELICYILEHCKWKLREPTSSSL